MNDIPIVRRPGVDPIADHMGRCKHFNGVRNTDCDAGVAYADVSIEGDFAYRYSASQERPYHVGRQWPCLRDRAAPFDVPECPHAEWPTRDEAEAHNAEMDAMIANTLGARSAIVAHIASTGADLQSDITGEVECPVCNGTLRYIRAACNGHIHAACSTDNCVGWME